VPGGWEVGRLEEFANITTGKLDSNQVIEKGKYPFFTCAPEPLSIDTFAFDDSVILIAGNNASGNFHINRFKGKFNAYQRTYVVTSKSHFGLDYLYYALRLELKNLKDKGQGSQTKFLTMSILNEIWIYRIKEEVLRKFNDIINPLFEKQNTITMENQELTRLRDFLLPLLMNGEVTLKC
jgi:type I restriction enzyme S subunit